MEDTSHITIEMFNRRDEDTFIDIYKRFYRELCYFASTLYRNCGVDPEDIVSELFTNLWASRSIKFETLGNLKAYLYVSIKNGFKNYLKHQYHVRKYCDEMTIDEDYFITKMAETETYSVISSALTILPEECARIFRMTMNGWNTDEIAEKLGKSKSTIYEHKQNAVKIIKKKISRLILIFHHILS